MKLEKYVSESSYLLGPLRPFQHRLLTNLYMIKQIQKPSNKVTLEDC